MYSIIRMDLTGRTRVSRLMYNLTIYSILRIRNLIYIILYTCWRGMYLTRVYAITSDRHCAFNFVFFFFCMYIFRTYDYRTYKELHQINI